MQKKVYIVACTCESGLFLKETNVFSDRKAAEAYAENKICEELRNYVDDEEAADYCDNDPEYSSVDKLDNSSLIEVAEYYGYYDGETVNPSEESWVCFTVIEKELDPLGICP